MTSARRLTAQRERQFIVRNKFFPVALGFGGPLAGAVDRRDGALGAARRGALDEGARSTRGAELGGTGAPDARGGSTSVGPLAGAVSALGASSLADNDGDAAAG